MPTPHNPHSQGSPEPESETPFQRFQALAKRIVGVPKQEADEQEAKYRETKRKDPPL